MRLSQDSGIVVMAHFHLFAHVFWVALVFVSQRQRFPGLFWVSDACHCTADRTKVGRGVKVSQWFSVPINRASFTCTAPNHDHCSLVRHIWFLDTGKTKHLCPTTDGVSNNTIMNAFLSFTINLLQCYTYIVLISQLMLWDPTGRWWAGGLFVPRFCPADAAKAPVFINPHSW